ncbi:hypothetical protein EAF00_006034 [Botryotinia globosa]|nr:hypothetical protein EAF00_006034 [Botryotinia globosa]
MCVYVFWCEDEAAKWKETVHTDQRAEDAKWKLTKQINETSNEQEFLGKWAPGMEAGGKEERKKGMRKRKLGT